MNSRLRTLTTSALLALPVSMGLGSPAQGQETLQAQVDSLQAEVARLRADDADTWLNERRAEEVKGLIREVLADAETRASLLEDGITAGYDKGFFLASPDKNFLLKIGGQMQFRYVVNNQDDRTDETDNGFQFRRTKLNFAGHIADPKLGYDLTIAAERGDGNVVMEDALMSYKLTDDLKLSWGKFKLPFLREELTSSKRQLAVDRSSVTEFFTLNRGEQVQLGYSSDFIRAAVSVNDGANSEFTDYAADAVEAAFTGRADIKLAGNWKQMDDFTAWSGEDFAAFLGGAVHYELGDGANGATSNYLGYTVDGSVECSGANLFAAFNGGHIEPDAAGANDRDMYGLLIQGGYQVIPDTLEPFARWEWLDDGAAGTTDLQALTAGFNWYMKKHNAKFTADVVWMYDGDDPVGNPYGASELSSGLGLASGLVDGDDQIALRAQFQLLF
jgi:hypothetical protein